MAKLNIVYYPSEILTQEAEAVRNVDGVIAQFMDDMAETMYKNQGVGLAAQARIREHFVAHVFIERRIAMHLAFDFERRRAFMQYLERFPHFHREREIIAAEIGRRQQRHFRLQTEAFHLLRRQH